MSAADSADQPASIVFEADEDGIALLTVNRPDKLNTLNAESLDALEACIDTIGRSDEIRGVILTGAGERCFVAGADIAEFLDLTVRRGEVATGEANVPKLRHPGDSGIFEEGRGVARRGQAVFEKIERLDKPVIAAINGFALGGGCELAMACHIRIASDRAKFGQPEVRLGIIPGYGGTQRLTRLVGAGIAAEMILTGEMIGAKRALEIGLVNRVVNGKALLGSAYAMMRTICQQAPVAVGSALEAIRAVWESGSGGFETEADLFGKACATKDFEEGISAFLEKRKPKFIGK